MAATKRTSKTRTAESKREEMEALHQQLADGVEALRGSQQWARYLAFCASFHHYSFSNLVLIWMQRPEATQVAGYRAWQAKGRQVRKGERGLRILGTGTVKVSAQDDDEASKGDSAAQDGAQAHAGKRRIFFPVSVFDIAQTDVLEGHEDASTVTHTLAGEDVHGILARVVQHLTSAGVVVDFEEISHGANGYTSPAGQDGEPVRVVIEARNSPAQQAKTALHEAAHIALGHLEDGVEEYLSHRGRCEVEAESVAYVLAGLLGLDSSAYSTGYVATWAERADSDVVKSTATRVLAAVHTLSQALDVEDEEDEQHAAA